MEGIQIHIERSVRDQVEIKVKGRIDSSGSGRLQTAMEEEVRKGCYLISLNLAEVSFLSSAGIRVLLTFHKQLRELGGGLRLPWPSENVGKVLELAGLSQLLVTASADDTPRAGAATAAVTEKNTSALTDRLNLIPRTLQPEAGYRCQLYGEPRKLALGQLGEADVRDLLFPANTLGLGLGALGGDFRDCRERFGEFLAVGGATAFLPTNRGGKPDYSVLTGQLIPKVKALYAIRCEGAPSHQVRFETNTPEDGSLSSILTRIAEFTPGPSKAVIILAEGRGLVGAALRTSPLSVQDLFTFPGIREALTFTMEPAFANCLALIVGIVSRETGGPLSPFLRPLRPGFEWLAHLHAVAFPYRPLKKEGLQLEETVQQLCTTAPILGVLHLMYDSRELVGLGESHLVQGHCWVGDLLEVRVDRGNEQ